MRITISLCTIVCLACCSTAWAEDSSGRCENNAELLKCTIGAIKQLEQNLPTDAAVYDERVRRYLQMLAKNLGYSASAEDLLELKRRSLDLKHHPRENATAIAALDNAIASAAGEIRNIMSIEALASRSEVGLDIYPEFVRRKLQFLDSEKGRFYYEGIFELEVLELLGNALESTYFLDRMHQTPDTSKLEHELNIIHDITTRMNDEKYDYILRNRKGSQTDLNSVTLWQASVSFVLGRRDELKNALQDLINKNWRFTGQTVGVGQVFVYKSLDLPYEIIVRSGKDENGKQNYEVNDPHRIQEFHDASQLALSLCAILDKAGDKGVDEFVKLNEQFVNRDYYVILATAASNGVLKEFAEAIEAETRTERLDPEGQGVLKRVDEVQDPGLAEVVRRGAQLCEIDGSVRDEVYKPFRLEPSIWGPGGKEGDQYQLRVGGGIDENQATIIAKFFKVVYSSSKLHAMSQKLKIEADPYVARPRISGRD